MQKSDLVQSHVECDWCAFSLGQPDEELLGHELIASAAEKVAERLREKDGIAPFMVQYGHRLGPRQFREAVSKTLLREALDVDSIALTAGNSAAIGVVAPMLAKLNKAKTSAKSGWDDVIVEVPTYFLAEGMFHDAGCSLVGVPREGRECGSAASMIETTLQERANRGLAPPAMMYIIPYFHNPCGCSYDEEEILKLVKLAEQYDTYVVFDEPYNMLSFDGVDKVHAAVLNRTSTRAISLGSFSKILAPGLRTGYLLGSPETIEKVYTSSGTIISGGGANPFPSQIVTDIMNGGHLREHINSTRTKLSARMSLLFDELATHGIVDRSKIPKGGYFAWIELGRGGTSGNSIDTGAEEFLSLCKKSKLTVTPGHRCLIPEAINRSFVYSAMRDVEERARNSVRLCVAHTSDDLIRKGVKSLAAIIKYL